MSFLVPPKCVTGVQWHRSLCQTRTIFARLLITQSSVRGKEHNERVQPVNKISFYMQYKFTHSHCLGRLARLAR